MNSPTPPERLDAPGPCVAALLSDGWRERVVPDWLARWDPVPFAIDGGHTHVVTMGDGPDLVLIPPSPGYKEAWVATAALLSRSFRVTTFDLRVRFPAVRSWDVLLSDLERVLDDRAPGRAIVAGHSMGGALAQRWALARPERVRGLVLSSTFAKVHDPPGNWLARYVEQPLVITSQRWLPDGPALGLARRLARRGSWIYDELCDEHVLAFVRFCMKDCPMDYVRSALALLFEHDTRTVLPRIACRTLVVVGERESVFARPAAEEVHRLVAGSEMAVSPRASHLHPLSSPAWLAAEIERWAAPLSAG
jgi:pimeloyl-ACP methyl ester carboxylesterase